MLPSRTNASITFPEEWIALCLLKDEDTGRLWDHSEEERCYVTQLEMNFPLEFTAGEHPLESIWRLPPPVCTDSSYIHHVNTGWLLLINPWQRMEKKASCFLPVVNMWWKCSLTWNRFPHENMLWITEKTVREIHVIISDNLIIAMCDIALGTCARGSRSGTAGAVGCILISDNCSRSCRSQT